MKKILVLTESIGVNDSSGAKANVALIKNLKYAGISVKVLHLGPKHSESRRLLGYTYSYGAEVDDVRAIAGTSLQFLKNYKLNTCFSENRSHIVYQSARNL